MRVTTYQPLLKGQPHLSSPGLSRGPIAPYSPTFELEDEWVAGTSPAMTDLERPSQLHPEMGGDREDVLVAAPAHVHDHQMVLGFLRRELDDLSKRMCGFERRDDAFEPTA